MNARKNQQGEKVIAQSEFDGCGQGKFSLRMIEQSNGYFLSVSRSYDHKDQWLFTMRRLDEFNFILATENFQTMLYRASLWFLEGWLDWINKHLDQTMIQRDNELGWVKYVMHPIEGSPFSDTEPSSPIAVIDCYFSLLQYPNQPRPSNPDWQVEPWAAVFLTDASCLTCLPENEDRNFFLLDLLPELERQAQGLAIDRADFLGALHSKFQPPVYEFDFLQGWGMQ